MARVKAKPPVAIDLVKRTLPDNAITSSVDMAPMETIIVAGSAGKLSALESAADSVSIAKISSPADLTMFKYLLITRFGAAVRRTSIFAPLVVGLETTLYCKLTSFRGRGIYCSASQ